METRMTEVENTQLRELNAELATQVRENRAEIGRLRERCELLVDCLVDYQEIEAQDLLQRISAEDAKIGEVKE